ncbi:hypothetical protein [Micromonospora sp. NPDC007230]|uniref:hypothetical protein n=1 Tax=Micromonospora sp. NPDC007230 TaxID=3364237 RepID=UPI0036BDB493
MPDLATVVGAGSARARSRNRGDNQADTQLNEADLRAVHLRAAIRDPAQCRRVPVIVVLVSGRPLDVAGELPNWT